MSLSEDLIREISKTADQYRRRVYLMAGIYVLLNVTAILSIIIIVWQYRLFVTLAQRSNIETLTLAIIAVLFAYFVITTYSGLIGAVKMFFYNLPLGGGGETDDAAPADAGKNKGKGKGKDDKNAAGDEAAPPPLPATRRRAEARKQSALKKAEGPVDKAYFNYAFEAQDQPDGPICIPIEDEAGSLGDLIIDGAEARLEAVKKGLSNTLFEYVLNQIKARLKQRDLDVDLEIVEWSSVDDEEAAKYHSQVQAFRTLATQLDKGPIWPTQQLTAADIAYIGQRVRAIVPYLRDECFLPDVEYEAEYSIPIIPEPLGFIALRRTDQRADPVATMGCASLVTLGILLLLVLFLYFPPWIPSK